MVCKDNKSIIISRISHTEHGGIFKFFMQKIFSCRTARGNRYYFRTTTLCLLCVMFFLLTTCKSIPVMPESFLKNERFLPIDEGASVYLVADVLKARSILNLLPIEELKDNQAKEMLDKTGYAVAALFPEESGRRFQLAAWGNYPSFRAGFAFTFDKNWKRQRSPSGDSYWHSENNGLSLALTSEQAFAAGSLDKMPVDPLSSSVQKRKQIPSGFNDFRAGAPLSFWLEDPHKVISGLFNEAGIPIQFPIQQLFVNIFPAKDGSGNFEADIFFLMENTSQSRGMTAILNLASKHIPAGSDSIIAMLFFANPPVQNDRSLDLKSAVLDENDISMLFSIFFGI